MIRIASALVVAAFAAAPVAAISYSAKPASPAQAKVVARDVVWACGAAACTGSSAEGRPAIVCQSLVKKIGRVDSFTANGRAFAAAELDRCNAAAKAAGNTAVAANSN